MEFNFPFNLTVVVKTTTTTPTHKVCGLCYFSDEHGRSQRNCPKVVRNGGTRLLCVAIGSGENTYFVRKDKKQSKED